jgi:hypothetical protein
MGFTVGFGVDPQRKPWPGLFHKSGLVWFVSCFDLGLENRSECVRSDILDLDVLLARLLPNLSFTARHAACDKLLSSHNYDLAIYLCMVHRRLWVFFVYSF